MKNTGLLIALGVLAYLYMKGSGQGVAAVLAGGGGSTGSSDIDIGYDKPEITGSALLVRDITPASPFPDIGPNEWTGARQRFSGSKLGTQRITNRELRIS